jgi:histidinol-phosphate aminotransferase
MFFRDDLQNKKAVQIKVPRKKTMMCLNESTLDPFSVIKDSFLKKMKNVHLNRYFNQISTSLKEKMALYTGVDSQQLLFGNGADEILYYIFTAVRNSSEDYAVSLSPSYFDYKSYTSAVGMQIKFLNLDEKFDFDEEKYLQLCTNNNCKLAILCNPNNPTGNLFSKQKMLSVIEKCNKLVLVDETYFEFSGETLQAYLEQFPNLILVRSFSKSFSSAGLRFGYAISNQENIEQLKKVVTAFNLSLLTQTFVDTMLDFQNIFLEHTQNVVQMRNMLYKNLNKLAGIEAKPSATNFLAFTAGHLSSQLFQKLQKNEIAVRDIGAHPLLKNYLRVTVGSSAENDKFLKTIQAFIEGRK